MGIGININSGWGWKYVEEMSLLKQAEWTGLLLTTLDDGNCY